VTAINRNIRVAFYRFNLEWQRSKIKYQCILEELKCKITKDISIFLVEIGIYKKGDSFLLAKFEIIELSTNFKLKRFYLSDVSL